MANTPSLTTNCSVSFGSQSSSSNELSLEEYSPKARIDPSFPALGDVNFRYVAVYGTHVKSDQPQSYVVDVHLCSARKVYPSSVTNSSEAVAPKASSEVSIFSGTDTLDVSALGLVGVSDIKIIGKFYRLEGNGVLEGSAEIRYDSDQKCLRVVPAGVWYGCVTFTAHSQGDLWLVQLDGNRLPGESSHFVASSFYFDSEQNKVLPVVVQISFDSSDAKSEVSRNISLEEYTPSEVSKYYGDTSVNIKFVDLWIDRPSEKPTHQISGSDGVVVSLVADCSKESTDVTSFQNSEKVSVSAAGVVSASMRPIVLYDSELRKINPKSVSFQYDAEKNALIPNPQGTYSGAGVLTAQQKGFRYKVDISKAPTVVVRDVDGNPTVKKVAVVTAIKVWKNPITSEAVRGISEVILDSEKDAAVDATNELVVESVGKDDPRVKRLYLSPGTQVVEVFADHPESYEWFLVTGGRQAAKSAASYKDISKTTISEQLTLNGDASIDFSKPGLYGSPRLKVSNMVNELGQQVSPEASYNSSAKKITFNPSGKYYGVVEASYTQKGDRYLVSIDLEDTDDDGFKDTYKGTFVAFSTWRDTKTRKSYPVYVSVDLTEAYTPREITNAVSLESYEKALGHGDPPLSKLQKYYAVYGNLGGLGLNVSGKASLNSAGNAVKPVNEIVSFSGSTRAGLTAGIQDLSCNWVFGPVDEFGNGISVGLTFDTETNELVAGTGSNGKEESKVYGLVEVHGTAYGQLYQVVLEPSNSKFDVGYAQENQSTVLLYGFSSYQHPDTGEALTAMVHTAVTGLTDDTPQGENPSNPTLQEFSFKIEQSEIQPNTNSITGRTDYFLKVYPCPTSLMFDFVCGDDLFLGVEGYTYSNNSMLKVGERVPKKIFAVRKSTFINNTSRISLDHLVEYGFAAVVSNVRDVFGKARMAKVLGPGNKYKRISWRKDNVRRIMIPEAGTGNAHYDIVGPQEMVVVTELSNPATGETYFGEIPVLADLEYQYMSSYGTIVATWRHTVPRGPSVVIETHSGLDKVMHVSGRWIWPRGPEGSRMLYGAGSFAASNQNVVLQRTAKGGSLVPRGGTV